MSVRAAPSRGTAPGDAATYYADEGRGYGWLLFAGSMLALVGTMNFIEGIAAISRSHFFVGHAEYVFGSLRTWGWVALFVGVAQGLIGVGIFLRNQIARWAGVAAAGINSVVQLLFMPAYPFWSLALFTLDILIIYGLITYGARTRRAN